MRKTMKINYVKLLYYHDLKDSKVILNEIEMM